MSPTNRYFNQTKFQPEQDLVQDLIDESIAIYGHDVYYIPRDTVNLDAFLGEDPAAAFTDAYPIEMYIKTIESFQGQSEFISKFGLHIEDQATFVVSQRRFDESVIQKNADLATSHGADSIIRPRENDLIFIEMTPTNRYLFEIRFVENKEQLFQLGKLYTYELRCEMMNFSNEKIKTDIPEIDGVASAKAYAVPMTMSADGNNGIDYVVGETVYQGTNLTSASATGIVWQWITDTRILYVEYPVGAFAASTSVYGANSGAIWTTTAQAIDPAPEVNDPISDNQELHQDPENVIVVRGAHMLDLD
jgi:hypothetical protein